MFNLTNRLRALASIFLVTISIGTAMATVTGVKWNKKWDANTKTLTDDPSGEQKAADWMADLPNNMFVAQVSIPGAHDFATGEITSTGSSSVSVCQTATMDELLEGGIRAIDFRPGCVRSGLLPRNYTYTLKLCHGTTEIDITFLEGMKRLATYLENHPKEFFVIHIFPGYNNQKNYSINDPSTWVGFVGEDARTKANELYQEALNDTEVSSRIVQFNPNLTVGEARGKIVIAVRPDAKYLTNDNQADIANWVITFSSEQRPARISLHTDANICARLHVQDISSPSDDGTLDVETKKVHMVKLLEYAQDHKTPMEMYNLNKYYTPEWVMNFLSMYSGTISTSDSYRENATTLNALLLDKLNGADGTTARLGAGPLGIMMMDYCLNTETNGDWAVYKVIENNFTGGADAPVVKFQIDLTNMTIDDWRKYPDNMWAGKKLFFRNMGAGEKEQAYCYLGGGGSWGASAVANYAGHYFTIETGDAGLRLGSVFGHLQNKDNEYWCDPRDNVDDYGTEFILTPAYWDGNPVYYITCQVCSRRLTAVPFTSTDENGNEVTNNPYYDTPSYNISPRDAVEGEPTQMWQMVAMTPEDHLEGYTIQNQDRLTRLKNLANKDRGMDATFLMPSYSFGNSDSSYTNGWTHTDGTKQAGWTLTYGQNLTTDMSQTKDNTVGREANDKGGMWRAVNTATEGNTFSLSTEVQKLPKGNYKFEFQYVSTAEGVSCKIGDNVSTQALAKNSEGITDLTPGSAEIAKAGTYFNENIDNGRVTITFEKTTDETTALKFEFVRESDVTEAASFYLDNLRLTYLGDTTEPMTTIKLRYPKPWGTICLPFKVEKIPEGLEVYKATGVSGVETQYLSEAEGGTVTYQVIQLNNNIAETTIEANYPYIVKHVALVNAQNGTQSATSPRRAETAAELAAKEYEFVGYPINRKNDYHDDYGVLTGLIEERTLANTEENYAITSSPLTEYTVTGETIYHADVQYFDPTADNQEAITISHNRAYVNARTESTQMVTADRVYFEDYQVVGVGRVTLDANEPVDVFDVTGICLRSGVKRSEALQGLSSGVYLLKGRSGISKVIHR